MAKKPKLAGGRTPIKREPPQASLANVPILSDLEKGWLAATRAMTDTGDYGHSVLPINTKSRKFYETLGKEGVTASNPLQFAGALGARALTDLGQDGTRSLYWRFNHPMQVAEYASGKAMGENIQRYTQPQKAAIGLAAVGLPVGASLGHLDVTNPGELFRPKGFAQNYAEVGSDDRRESSQVVPELIERVALGRQGRPLNYETIQKDIPGITKKQLADYNKFLYNDKGLLGIGVLKATPSNLQGEPEVRLAGFPIGLQGVGAGVGGTLAARAAMSGPKKTAARRVVGAGLAGGLAGAVLGKLTNRAIAQGARKDLPSTQEYGVTSYINKSGGVTKVENGVRYDLVVPPNPEYPNGLFSAGY